MLGVESQLSKCISIGMRLAGPSLFPSNPLGGESQQGLTWGPRDLGWNYLCTMSLT